MTHRNGSIAAQTQQPHVCASCGAPATLQLVAFVRGVRNPIRALDACDSHRTRVRLELLELALELGNRIWTADKISITEDRYTEPVPVPAGYAEQPVLCEGCGGPVPQIELQGTDAPYCCSVPCRRAVHAAQQVDAFDHHSNGGQW